MLVGRHSRENRASERRDAWTADFKPKRILSGQVRTQASLARLKWLAIIIPVAFLSLLHYLLHSVLHVFHDFPGILILLGLVAVGIVLFSFGVFRVIGILEQQILEQNRHLTTVNEIAAASAENLELPELLDVALDRVLEFMHVEAGIIYVEDTETGELLSTRYRGFSEGLARQIRARGLGAYSSEAEAVGSGLPKVIADLFDDPRIAEAAVDDDFRYAVGIPLMGKGRIAALLGVATKRERRFTEGELKLLASIGGQLGLAVRNATLFERTRQRNRELAALLAVGRAVTSSLNLSDVLTKALDAILAVTSTEVAEVWLAGENGELTLEQQRGYVGEAFRERTRLQPGEGLVGKVAEAGSPEVVHDLGSYPRFVRRKVKELGFQTFCALPLRHRGETLGVLAVAAHDREALTSESELSLLEGIGERLAVAIENSRLHEQVLDKAVLEERERIGRELHDGMAQVLGYVNTQTLAIRKLLASGRTDEAEQQTHEMEKVARQVYTDVREAILGLRTSLHPHDGLIANVRRYLRDYGQIADVALELDASKEAEAVAVPASMEVQLMRVIQEALSNIRKHARATEASVSFGARNGELTVEVRDDGQGYAPDRPIRTGWPRFGLQTMRERAEAIGGEFEVVSSPGCGTTVVVRVPLKKQTEVFGEGTTGG